MTHDKEIEFLKPFEEKSKTGRLVVTGEIKKAYEYKKIIRTVFDKTDKNRTDNF